jgi:hypothetical protein
MHDVAAQMKNDYGKLLAQRGIPLHSHNFYQKCLVSILTFATI